MNENKVVFAHNAILGNNLVVRAEMRTYAEGYGAGGNLRLFSGYNGIDLDIWSAEDLAELDALIDVLVDYAAAVREAIAE